jgi:2-polyprenyl-6-hydroxyphenyl methylase/3-demethylubiquinone-9 3-methyltransferase
MEREQTVNNAFYDDLGTKWHEETAHPIALLRAENALRNPWIADVIEKRLGTQQKILDIGCGGGLLTNALAKRGHTVSGIDLSASSLDIAKQADSTASVRYTLASADALPYPAETFDVVCAMDLLEHVDNPENVIAEASRVLKKNGLFFFHTFSRNLLSWFLVIKGVEWAVPNTPPRMHVYSLFLNPQEVELFCQKNSLAVEQILGVNPDFTCKAFWRMLFRRRIDPDFRFVFTKSLKTGYSGFARKPSTKGLDSL